MKEEAARANKAALQAMAAGNMRGVRKPCCAMPSHKSARARSALWLNLAVVRRQLQDFDGASSGASRRRSPSTTATSRAPDAGGAARRSSGVRNDAALAYAIALVQAPPDAELDAADAPGRRARREVHGDARRRARPRTSATTSARPAMRSPRPRSAASSHSSTRRLRTRKRYRQEPHGVRVPGCPTSEFYEREEFPLVAGVAGDADIQRDLRPGSWSRTRPSFSPFNMTITCRSTSGASSTSRRLERLPLLRQGPRDRGALRPGSRDDGRRPAPRRRRWWTSARRRAMILGAEAEDAHPAAHRAIASSDLVVHLPLVLRATAAFAWAASSVNGAWEKLWVFDDTIEHEAWNESDEIRIILICDIWSRGCRPPSARRSASSSRRPTPTGAPRPALRYNSRSCCSRSRTCSRPRNAPASLRSPASSSSWTDAPRIPRTRASRTCRPTPRIRNTSNPVQIVGNALARSREFGSFAIPKRIAPPLLCRYEPGHEVRRPRRRPRSSSCRTRRSARTCPAPSSSAIPRPTRAASSRWSSATRRSPSRASRARRSSIRRRCCTRSCPCARASGSSRSPSSSHVADQHERMQVYELNEIAAIEGLRMNPRAACGSTSCARTCSGSGRRPRCAPSAGASAASWRS